MGFVSVVVVAVIALTVPNLINNSFDRFVRITTDATVSYDGFPTVAEISAAAASGNQSSADPVWTATVGTGSVHQILAGVADHLAEVDEAIETYAQGWALARMPAVDRAIARVATWEIVWNDDVDAPVAVDEAITLARMLSTDDSPRYLSGLLGRIGDLADTLR